MTLDDLNQIIDTAYTDDDWCIMAVLPNGKIGLFVDHET